MSDKVTIQCPKRWILCRSAACGTSAPTGFPAGSSACTTVISLLILLKASKGKVSVF